MAYTKEVVINHRKCGLGKYFDPVVAQVGRASLIEQAILIAKKHPNIWDPGWSNFHWALGNAVIDFLPKDKSPVQSYNVDEALTPEEIAYVAKQLNLSPNPQQIWPRKQTKKG